MSYAAQERIALSALLARTADNSAFYAVLTAADGVCDISEMAGLRADPRYRLVRVDHRLGTAVEHGFEIALVDDIDSAVAYYDRVTLVRVPRITSHKVARNLIWRSASRRHSIALRDISQTVLFNYIVHKYDILLSADTMTDGGNFYWHRQVSRAIEKGLHVYVYDSMTLVLTPIPTQGALNDLQDKAWAGANQEALRAIISTSSPVACFVDRAAGA